MSTLFLSYFLHESTPAYAGAEGTITFEKSRSISKGDTSNNLKLTFPNHIGTHIDFPYHFNETGKKLDDYPAGFWIFNRVGFLNCNVDEIQDRLDLISDDIEFLILKTGFGAYRNGKIYWEQQPVIPANLAKILKDKFPKLRVFGFDLISLTSQLNKPEGKQAHLSFLCDNDILIVEDMNLESINNAPDMLVVAPLMISQADGAPCNIIAIFN